MVGGSHKLKWKDKYLKDIWGDFVQENYTKCKWHNYDPETGVIIKKYNYEKDRIPQYEIILDPDISSVNWHHVEANFKLGEDGVRSDHSLFVTFGSKSLGSATAFCEHDDVDP